MSSTPRSNPAGDSSQRNAVGLLIFAWLFVGIPLAWGVTQTVIKSMAFFH